MVTTGSNWVPHQQRATASRQVKNSRRARTKDTEGRAICKVCKSIWEPCNTEGTVNRISDKGVQVYFWTLLFSWAHSARSVTKVCKSARGPYTQQDQWERCASVLGNPVTQRAQSAGAVTKVCKSILGDPVTQVGIVNRISDKGVQFYFWAP